MKILITLKEKHLAFIGKYLNGMSIGEWGGVSNVIINALKTPDVQPDDECTVEVDHVKIIDIYSFLGYKTEREASVRNDEMKYALLPQFLTAAELVDPQDAMTVVLPEVIETAKDAAIAILQAIVTIDYNNKQSNDATDEIYRQWARLQ